MTLIAYTLVEDVDFEAGEILIGVYASLGDAEDAAVPSRLIDGHSIKEWTLGPEDDSVFRQTAEYYRRRIVGDVWTEWKHV